MTGILDRRALYTDARQAQHTFVSLGGLLEIRKKSKKEKFLIFEEIEGCGFLHKGGIRNGDNLVSVNFVQVNNVPFDLLVEAIRGLNPLVLGVKRPLNDGTVLIYVVMMIVADRGNEPFLKFHGLYFWKDTKPVDTDTIIFYIPIDVCPMTTYRYNGKVTKVTIIGHQDGNYWLVVSKPKKGKSKKVIEFRRRESGEGRESTWSLDEAYFTMYKYVSGNPRYKGTPVILVPWKKEYSSQCLAATVNNELILASFKESEWTGSNKEYPENERFLSLRSVGGNNKKIESSLREGYFLAKGPDDEAILSTDYIPLTIHELNETITS